MERGVQQQGWTSWRRRCGDWIRGRARRLVAHEPRKLRATSSSMSAWALFGYFPYYGFNPMRHPRICATALYHSKYGYLQFQSSKPRCIHTICPRHRFVLACFRNYIPLLSLTYAYDLLCPGSLSLHAELMSINMARTCVKKEMQLQYISCVYCVGLRLVYQLLTLALHPLYQQRSSKWMHRHPRYGL